MFMEVPVALHSQDTLFVNRNEVSFDFANIFRGELKPTFTYRYHFPKSAFRLKVSPTLDVQIGKHDKNTTGTTSTITKESTQNTSYGLTLALGYEKNEKIGKVWVYYGADLLYKDNWSLAFINSKKDDFDSTGTISGNSKSESEINTRTTRFGPAGIVGVRFFLHPRVAVSVETGLALFYRSYIQTRTCTGGEIKEQTKNRAMEISWNSALLNLSWFF